MKKNLKLLSGLFILSSMFLSSCGEVPYSQRTDDTSTDTNDNLVVGDFKKLLAPENISFDKNEYTVKWGLVNGASTYQVNVNGKIVSTVRPVATTSVFEFSLFSETLEGSSKYWNNIYVDATAGKIVDSGKGYAIVSKGTKFVIEVNDGAEVAVDAKTGIINPESPEGEEIPAKVSISPVNDNKVTITANDDFNLYTIAVNYPTLLNTMKVTLNKSVFSSGDEFLISVRAINEDGTTKSNYSSILFDMNAEESDNLFKYSLNDEDETIGITGIDTNNEKFSKNITLPDKITVNGRTYPVTKVADSAFFEVKGVTTITLPDSIVEIGANAFQDCKNLQTINLSPNLKKIGDYAFQGQTKLESFDLPSSVEELGAYAFANSPLKSFNIPSDTKLHIIGERCFAKSKYDSFTFPNTITSLGIYAFEDSAIKEFIFNEGFNLTEFSEGCFSGITGVKKFVLPESIEVISPYLFQGSKITHFSLNENHKITSIPNNAFEKCSTLYYFGIYDESKDSIKKSNAEYIIPEQITYIGDFAFSETPVVNLDFTNANNLESIGVSAFSKSKIKKVEFNDALKYIYATAFAYSLSLSKITFSSNSKIQCIDSTSFKDTKYADTLVDSKGFDEEVILGNVLIQLSAADQIKLGIIKLTKDDPTTPENEAEKDRFNQVEVDYSVPYKIPSNILGITNNLYANSNISNITLPKNLKHIGSGAFKNCVNIDSVIVPDTVNNIDDEAFDGCVNIENFSLGDVNKSELASIGMSAFRGVSKVETINLPNNVKTIGDNAFASGGDSVLKSFVISNESKLESIGKGAFSNNTNITSFNLPRGIKVLEDEVFKGCSSLSFVNIDMGTSHIESIGVSCFESTAISTINIPSTIKEIGAGAFKNCSLLEHVNFGSNAFVGVENATIKESTFENCTSLHHIELPDAITTIEINAFAGASLRDSVVSKASKIHKDAFKNSYLEQSFEDGLVRIGTVLISYHGSKDVLTAQDLAGITSINPNAFDKDSKVKSITLPDSLEIIDENAFDGCVNLESVYASENCNLNKIAANAFKDCKNLKSMVIPSNVETIESYAFYNCYLLNEVTFKTNKLESLPSYCFANCNSLESITFPANLNTIEAYAFYQTALKKVNFISSIENIEAYAFANIGKAANNKLAPSLWKITPTLKEINFEDNTNIYYIGKHAFENNILQSLDIPVIEGLTLDEFSFAKSNALQTVTLEEGLIVGKGIFSGSNNINTVNMHSDFSVTGIFGGANQMVPSVLSKVVILDGSTEIDAYEFAGLGMIKEVVLPSSVKTIGDYAFYGCRNLENIDLSKIEAIGEYSFASCDKLTNVNISSTLDYIGDKAFLSSKYLKDLASTESDFVIVNNILLAYTGNAETVTLPNNVEVVAGGAFAGNQSVKTIILSENTKLICNGAFDSCYSLTNIQLNYAGLVEVELQTLDSLSASLTISVNNQYLSLYYNDINWSLYEDYLPEK